VGCVCLQVFSQTFKSFITMINYKHQDFSPYNYDNSFDEFPNAYISLNFPYTQKIYLSKFRFFGDHSDGDENEISITFKHKVTGAQTTISNPLEGEEYALPGLYHICHLWVTANLDKLNNLGIIAAAGPQNNLDEGIIWFGGSILDYELSWSLYDPAVRDAEYVVLDMPLIPAPPLEVLEPVVLDMFNAARSELLSADPVLYVSGTLWEVLKRSYNVKFWQVFKGVSVPLFQGYPVVIRTDFDHWAVRKGVSPFVALLTPADNLLWFDSDPDFSSTWYEADDDHWLTNPISILQNKVRLINPNLAVYAS
jgi:hypothetical protein